MNKASGMSVRTRVARRGVNKLRLNAQAATKAASAAVDHGRSCDEEEKCEAREKGRQAPRQIPGSSHCKKNRGDPADQWWLCRDPPIWCVLINPMSLLHHLERRERLFSLVVIIQMPWKIRGGEQDDRQRDYAPIA